MKACVTTRIAGVRDAVSFTVAAEQRGFWGVGIVDTAPRIYQAVYPTVTACLMGTQSIKVATHVTNLVSQHWSVHASTARTFEDLAPGRFVLGLATGDGAVRSVGLRPARWAAVEADVRSLREEAPSSLDVQIAAAGPRGAAAAGLVGTDVMIGSGLDVPAFEYLAGIAANAADQRVRSRPLGKWVTIPICVIENERDTDAARAYMRGVAISMAHFALSGDLAGKNVPERWHDVLRDRLSRYDYGHHGALGKNSNAAMFEDHRDLESYIVDRMVIVGTVQQCRGRLLELAAAVGLDGVYLGPHALAGDLQAIKHLDLVADVVKPGR